jgi:thermostable 8-oxoguanine DNA glycosylase
MKKIANIKNLKKECEKAAKEYKYQPELTEKLDSQTEPFTDVTLLEIVLWKTNRYPTIVKDIIDGINDLRQNYSEQKARDLLSKMLDKEVKGFDLPMASTVLRFAVPNELQIIDQRVYRFITDEDSLKIPTKVQKKVELYFDYLAKLKEKCAQYNIPFSLSDRILYQLDKKFNKDIKLKTS